MGSIDPDDMDDHPERVLERLLRVLPADDRGDTDDGGAAVAVPAPRKPSPHDSAIALPLPIEDERD